MDTGDPVGKRPMVVAIDGPAGAGKSTVTKQVARRLGLLYLDTGAMYRAATVGLLAADVDLEDQQAIIDYVGQRQIDFDEAGGVRLDGTALGEQIRTPAVTAQIWRVADVPACREHLVRLQQGIISGRDAALEGRDATTVICPDAPLKIYLDASPEERARRRLQEWQKDGDPPSFDEVVQSIKERDERDSSRTVGALTCTDDAVLLATDDVSVEGVISQIMALAIQRRPLLLERLVQDQVLVGRSREPGYHLVAEGSINDPPAPWQLGLTNPSPERLPDNLKRVCRNGGGRQAGIVIQGRAVLVLCGRGESPGQLVALPMLPQSWYVIEPGVWHAVVQEPGCIGAWAEASGIVEDHADLSAEQCDVWASFRRVLLP